MFIEVKFSWPLKDLTISLKHTKVTRSVGRWPNRQQVCFPEVERKNFIPLEVKRGKPSEPIAIKSCIGWSILGGCPMYPPELKFKLILSVEKMLP